MQRKGITTEENLYWLRVEPAPGFCPGNGHVLHPRLLTHLQPICVTVLIFQRLNSLFQVIQPESPVIMMRWLGKHLQD